MQLQRQLAFGLAVLTLASLQSCVAESDFINDAKRALTGGGDTKVGLGVNVGDSGAKIGVRTDDGNPFYYEECSAKVSIDSGLDAGCRRVWKPLFYVCIAGGGVLAVLLLSCCCCCCCAPCRRKRAAATTYYPVLNQTSSVILVNPEAPRPASRPPPGYDVALLQA